ncbi:hypothetical protein B0H17DRAFT_1108528 [Mycena rosella]|uniref:Uncharacterized protein n=1 Tax=Mycena rosella TaxID=1033263 RepID=A0AAD7BVA2_MYCRO|nr:hypothetical protein B0H17DRAFT_1108528 [Mycena rosella]
MAPKYLCCLPLRFGVLVLSFLQFAASAFAAVILAIALVLDAEHKTGTTRIPTGTRVVAIITVVVQATIAIICLFGFIGAIRKKESFVSIFATLLKFSLVVHVTAVVATVILYAVDKDEFRKQCIGASTNQKVIDACTAPNSLDLWVVIVVATVPLIFQAYGVYIVSSYDKALLNESHSSLHPMHLHRESFEIGTAYVPVGEESHSLTSHPQASYPYAEKSHSFGADHV